MRVRVQTELGVYGKIFESMYDGTLAADWKAMVTFQQLIVLADYNGIVEYTPAALSRRTGIPLDIIEHGIKKLEEPDEWSKSPDEEGRRICRMAEHRPWGWYIVNYDEYKALASRAEEREKARIRKQKQRERERQATESPRMSQDVTGGHGESRMSRHVDVDVDVDEKTKGTRVPFQAIVDLYHEHCPDLPRVKVLSPKRKAHLRSRWKTLEVERGQGEKAETIKFDNLENWERYFKFITEKCPFLTGKNDRAWTADFDFCIRESAMVNVMENKYVERK
jgi:hypothetical protein